MSPVGSTNLTPLSHSGLCEAVTITPIHFPPNFWDLNTAARPTRYIAQSRTDALLCFCFLFFCFLLHCVCVDVCGRVWTCVVPFNKCYKLTDISALSGLIDIDSVYVYVSCLFFYSRSYLLVEETFLKNQRASAFLKKIKDSTDTAFY